MTSGIERLWHTFAGSSPPVVQTYNSSLSRRNPGMQGLWATDHGMRLRLLNNPPPPQMIPEFAECLTKAIAQDLAKKETEANKSMRMLEVVGDRARNYTCADPEMETTNSTLPSVKWQDPEGGLTYSAQVRGRGGDTRVNACCCRSIAFAGLLD